MKGVVLFTSWGLFNSLSPASGSSAFPATAVLWHSKVSPQMETVRKRVSNITKNTRNVFKITPVSSMATCPVLHWDMIWIIHSSQHQTGAPDFALIMKVFGVVLYLTVFSLLAQTILFKNSLSSTFVLRIIYTDGPLVGDVSDLFTYHTFSASVSYNNFLFLCKTLFCTVSGAVHCP